MTSAGPAPVLSSSRRTFLRRAAAAGLVVYTVPAVQVITMDGASAASASGVPQPGLNRGGHVNHGGTNNDGLNPNGTVNQGGVNNAGDLGNNGGGGMPPGRSGDAPGRRR